MNEINKKNMNKDLTSLLIALCLAALAWVIHDKEFTRLNVEVYPMGYELGKFER